MFLYSIDFLLLIGYNSPGFFIKSIVKCGNLIEGSFTGIATSFHAPLLLKLKFRVLASPKWSERALKRTALSKNPPNLTIPIGIMLQFREIWNFGEKVGSGVCPKYTFALIVDTRYITLRSYPNCISLNGQTKLKPKTKTFGGQNKHILKISSSMLNLLRKKICFKKRFFSCKIH